jgi:uncharacterized membrane protein YfcA
MNQPPSWISERTPSMFLYSCLFGLVYIGGAAGIGYLVVTFGPAKPHSMSSLGHVLAILGAFLSGFAFVKREKRLFTTSEQRRLVVFCFCWIAFLEVIALYGYADQLRAMPAGVLVGILVFGLALDGVIVWAAFRYVVRKFMAKRLSTSQNTA